MNYEALEGKMRQNRWKDALIGRDIEYVPTNCEHRRTIWVTGGRLYCLDCDNILEGRSLVTEKMRVPDVIESA